ncbi:long-chain fatty acid--CoA ligase [Streptomyces luteolifulvus]|uniref:Long-chain fatty acid--CoA ligase n=1 Tax=Streptomyces luteolifulvus TaxID=2615112 RepID=A0A6H9UN29_9ACTN|nr:AMP-binding protein [Streptomyces luteolifulvus]KAB1139407.1 long-chain fatty acid--CoA ligase [Streptomyces luteolifulvus]
MSWFDDRPWTAQYTERLREVEPAPARTTLELLSGAVATAPDSPATTYLGGTLTYREVDELSDGVAHYLLERGCRPGDRLAVYLQNIPQFLLALFGAWKAGGAVVPLNPMYRDELAHILTDAGVSAIVCDEQAWAEHVRERATTAGVTTALTACPLDLQTLDDARIFAGLTRERREGADDILDVARARVGRRPTQPGLTPDDIALISYTSGTSGLPKGATNTHRNLTVNAVPLRLHDEIPPGSPIFALAPLFHITGMVVQLLNAVDLASPLVLAHRFEPGVVIDTLKRERPAYMVGPSTAYMALMAHPDFSAEAFASLRTLNSGGAPLPPAVVERFREQTGLYIRNGYGLTETSSPCVVVPVGRQAPVDPDSGTLSIGLPLPAAMVRIVDEEGRDLGPNVVGEIAVEGPMVVPAYWNRPDATAESIPNGRLLTGDVGFVDRQGWVYVVDRKKDMINASGFKVWPREVEDVLYRHPAVREAAVVGVSDPYRGETVAAFVSLRPEGSVEPEELVAHCREHLAAYKAPRTVSIRDDLPKTTSGKILRRELRGAASA